MNRSILDCGLWILDWARQRPGSTAALDFAGQSKRPEGTRNPKSKFWRVPLLLLLLLGATSTAFAAPKPKVDPALARRYEALADSIDPKALDQTIRTLS